jgi:hypothetical protein
MGVEFGPKQKLLWNQSYDHQEPILRPPGANPTIVSYNASAVKIYNATSNLVRFENKNCFQLLPKNGLAYYSAGVVALNS